MTPSLRCVTMVMSLLGGLKPAAARWSRPVFVWGIWAGMFVAALGFVARYGHNLPYYDGWSLVYTLAGTHAIDLEWLWYPRNGHRIAVPKLVMLGLLTATDWDFRVNMFASVVLLGMTSWVLIWAASKSRGSLSYSDAAFPLLLLNWGHYDNMIWGWQLSQVLPIAVAGLLLGAIVRWRLEPPFAVALLAAVGVVTLPLSGVPGLACAPGFVLWLLAVGHRRWLQRQAKARQEAAAIWLLASLALLLVPAYFVGLRNTGIGSPDLVSGAKAIVAFLAHGYGFAADILRPWSMVIVLVLFFMATLALLAGLGSAEPGRRLAARALLCALLAFAGLALSVGVARPTTTFPHRYFLFAVPALCWLYLVADLARRDVLARIWRMALLGLALIAVAYNTPAGLDYASTRSAAMRAFEADIRAGLPPSALIARHQRTVLPFPEDGGAYWHDSLAFSFEVLHRAGVGAFAALAPEVAFDEIDVEEVAAVAFVAASDVGADAWVWTLPEALYLGGVRVRQPAHFPEGMMWTLEWSRDATEPLTKAQRYVHWWLEDEASATVWIYDGVARLRVAAPDGAGAANPPALILLVPR